MLTFWSHKFLFIFVLAGILWIPSASPSTSELTPNSTCSEQKEVAMVELPHHIDLLRWVPKASLLSPSTTLGLIGMVRNLLKHTPMRDEGSWGHCLSEGTMTHTGR